MTGFVMFSIVVIKEVALGSVIKARHIGFLVIQIELSEPRRNGELNIKQGNDTEDGHTKPPIS